MITRAALFERFAGRDDELRHLLELRARSQRDGRGGSVAIAGDAGVGKSRLLYEFEAACRSDRGAFVRVRCEETAVAYAPFVRALDELSTRRELRQDESIAAALRALTTNDERPESSAAERARARFDTVATALRQATTRLGHVTLAFEDAHWSDLSSLEGMRVVAALAERVPLVLAVTYRPDDLAADHSRAAAFARIIREGADRIALGPLHYGDLLSLLRQLLPNASHRLLRRIYELSDGKPYVAEELARSVIERGDQIDFEPTLSLRSAILERVNRLPHGGREVLARAAIVGRSFTPEDLRALGTDDERSIAALRAAVDLQLLEDRTVDERPWFRFRHALTREILYRDLFALERRTLHRAFADHLAAFPERVAELAYHLDAAGERTLAFAASERAGDDARGLAAFADAARFYATAVRHARDDAAALGRTAVKLAQALEDAGDLDELTIASARDAARLDELGRPTDALAVRMVAVRAISPTRLADSLPILERLRAGIDAQTPPDVVFAAELLTSKVMRLQGRVAESLDACARAEASIAEPTPRQRNDLLLSQAHTYLRLNELAKAEGALRQRQDHAIEGDDVEAAHTIGTLALVAYRRGRLREAFEHSRAAAAMWEHLGRKSMLLRQLGNSAWYAAQLGDFEYVELLVEQMRRDDTLEGEALTAARMRVARAVGGDPEPFAEVLERALASGTAYLAYMLGCDIVWMLEDDLPRVRSILRRLVAMIPSQDFEAGLLEAVVEFGTDEDVAQALASHAAADFGPDDVTHAIDEALAMARLALRERRLSAASELARTAAKQARDSGNWHAHAHALWLAGDRVGARSVLLGVGATGELARLERGSAPPAEAAREATAPKLTARELQIAQLVASGLSSRDAAIRLAIAPRTVETHLANVYAKLGVSSRVELAHFLNPEAHH